MGNIVITTGYPGSGWSVALASLAPEQFVHPVPDAIEDWRAQAAAENSSVAPAAEVIEHLQTWPRHAAGQTQLLADARDLWLLEHWAQRLPEARFLLFFTDPETALAHGLQNACKPAAFLQGWRDSVRHLTGFQRRYRGRTLLLDAASARRDPAALLAAAERLGLQLALRDPRPDEDEVLVFERLIARRWLAREVDSALLRAELEAHASPLAEAVSEPEPNADQLLARYRQDQIRHQRLSAARDEQAQRAEEQTQRADAQARQAAQYQAEAEQNQAKAAQYQAEADKSAKALEAEQQRARELEAARQETAEENELLLAQLHQVQEELEQYFLKYQELVKIQQGGSPEQGSSLEQEPAPEQAPQALPPSPKRQRRKRPAALKARGPFAKNRKERRRLERYTTIIRESGLFDESWYLSQYPDVADAGYDPIEHYVCHGVRDQRNPAPWFDTAFYLETHPDVAASIMNPLVHYHQFGKAEQRPTRRGW